MDDQYAISLAMTEFRDGWNGGDVNRILSAFADEFTNWSEDTPSFYGSEGRSSMELHLKDILATHDAEMKIQMITIAISGASATDRGWLNLTLKPKRGGEPKFTKYRYFHNWARQADGKWKIKFVMTNVELQPKLLPEKSAA